MYLTHYSSYRTVVLLSAHTGFCTVNTVNVERFAGLNICSFNPMKFFNFIGLKLKMLLAN